MARRKSASDLKGWFFIFVVGGIIWIAIQAFNLATADPIAALLGLAALIALTVFIVQLRKQKRIAQISQTRQALLSKYEHSEIADAIMVGAVWQGMTREQLIDAWGHPEDIDRKIMRTKVVEIYKFRRIGRNRFARRATLENDHVVAWEEK